jgi:hypothetical protein
MRSFSTLRLANPLLRPASRPFITPITHRTLTTSPAVRAYKDDQDRESLAPRAHDGTQSSSDESAAHSEQAFDRHNTDPKKSKEENPEDLEVSGANQEINKPQGDNPAAEKTATRADREGSQRSGHGGGNKTKAGRPT